MGKYALSYTEDGHAKWHKPYRGQFGICIWPSNYTFVRICKITHMKFIAALFLIAKDWKLTNNQLRGD